MKKTKKQSNGLYVEWHENWVKVYYETYKDGKKEGLAEWWDGNGVKVYYETHKYDKEDGLAEGWYDSGVKAYSINHNLAEGWRSNVVSRGVYDNDKLVKRLSPDISLQEAIDNGEIADLSLELQDLVKHAAKRYIKKKGKMNKIKKQNNGLAVQWRQSAGAWPEDQ